jgi:hypothetical protein
LDLAIPNLEISDVAKSIDDWRSRVQTLLVDLSLDITKRWITRARQPQAQGWLLGPPGGEKKKENQKFPFYVENISKEPDDQHSDR